MSILKSEVTAVGDVGNATRAAMFALYADHYAGVSRDLFLSDLEEKSDVLLVRDADETIVGFSTLAVTATRPLGTPLQTIFSGDTIMRRDLWGHQALAFAWLKFAGRIKARRPDLPLYWLLITKGHRTYRYLTAFSLAFFPHWSRPTPLGDAALMHALAEERFADHYDPASGLVRYEISRGHLRPELATVSTTEMRRPDVRFFLERNPRYAAGDELVCLTELAPDNLKPIARRLFLEGIGE